MYLSWSKNSMFRNDAEIATTYRKQMIGLLVPVRTDDLFQNGYVLCMVAAVTQSNERTQRQ